MVKAKNRIIVGVVMIVSVLIQGGVAEGKARLSARADRTIRIDYFIDVN